MKKKRAKKTVKRTKKTSAKNTQSLFEEIDAKLQKGLTVDDIFVIRFLDDDKTGALMDVGFTEIGNQAIKDLMKRNPKITEKDIEDYIRRISARLIVLVSEKLKAEEEEKNNDALEE